MVLAGILLFAILFYFDGDKCDNRNGNDRDYCLTNAKLSDKPDCVWCDRHIDRHVAGFPKGRTTCGEGEMGFCEKGVVWLLGGFVLTDV